MTYKTRFPSFSRNIIANWIAFLFVAGVSFYLSPFIVHSLGNAAYGVWALLGSLVGYLGLLDFGVRGAVTRYIAHHHAADRPEECQRTVSAGVLLFGGLGLLAMALAGLMAYVTPTIFNVPKGLIDETRIVILLGGFNVAIALIGGVFGGVLAGLQRYDVSSGIEIVVTIIRTTAVLLLLSAGYGLVALAVVQLLSSLLTGSAAWFAARKLYPALRLQFNCSTRSYMPTLLSFGFFSSLIHISGVLIYYSDSLVIAAFLPVGMVTFYAISASLCDYARQIVSALSTIITPRVSALNALGGETLEETVIGAARIATLITAPIVATFWWRGETFINLWMGPDYGTQSGEVLQILGAVVWLGGARAIAVSTIMGLNKHRLLVPWLGLEALCNLALSVALVRYLGLVGVALGTLIPSFIVSVGYLPTCLRKTTGIRASVFYRDAWLVPTVACIPFAVATFLVEVHFPPNNMALFFFQVAVIMPLIPAVAVPLCLTQLERRKMALWLRRATEVARHIVLRTPA